MAAAVVVAGVLGLAACGGGSKGASSSSSSSAPPNPFASTTSAAGSSTSEGADAASTDRAAPAGRPRGSLEVGQCFDATTFAAGRPIDPATITLVLCAHPHQHEVYALVQHPGGDGAAYPGDAALDAYADDRCIAAFTPYVGTPYDRSALDFATVHPDARSWADGDRQVACTLHDADLALLTGSMRGAGR